jgi:hypothetical protein
MAKVSNVYTLNKSGNKNLTVGDIARRVLARSKEGESSKPGRYSRHYRNPMVVTCNLWEYQKKEGIVFYVNPSDVRWNIPFRGSVTKTAAGTIQNVWPNRYRNGSIFDDFTIDLSFQAGNIMPFMAYPGQEFSTADDVDKAVNSPGVPPGLENFYRFLSLLDAPRLIGAGENRHIIVHHSRLFPTLTLEGFFKVDQPLGFQESVNSGNTHRWEATFQVYRTVPRISSYSQLVNMYHTYIRQEGLAEALPQKLLQERSNPFYEGIPRGSQATTSAVATPSGTTTTNKQVAARSDADTSGYDILRLAGVTSGLPR